MDISPNALRRDTVQTLREIDEVLSSIRQEAEAMDKEPTELLDQNNNWVMTAPLLAKAQCLQTLTLLNESGRRR